MAEQTEKVEKVEKTEKVEAVKNCAECKKAISRAKRYYRNGAYYCNKNCFKKKMAEAAGETSESESNN